MLRNCKKCNFECAIKLDCVDACVSQTQRNVCENVAGLHITDRFIIFWW